MTHLQFYCKQSFNSKVIQCRLSCKVVKLNVQISQGNAAADLKQVGRLYDSLFSSSFQNTTVKGLLSQLSGVGYVSVKRTYPTPGSCLTHLFHGRGRFV